MKKTFFLVLTALAAACSVHAYQLDGLPVTNSVPDSDFIHAAHANGSGGYQDYLASPSAIGGGAFFVVTTNEAATPGTRTAGIQEAINKLPLGTSNGPGGGMIIFGPGIFQTADTITMPTNQQYSFTLTLRGAGNTATVILQTNLIPNDLIRLDPSALGGTNEIVFNADDICFSSVTNATTNLINLTSSLVGGVTYKGTIGSGRIDNCLFGWWTRMLEFGRGLSTDRSPVDGTNNLVAISLTATYSGSFDILRDTFCYCIPFVTTSDNFSFTYNQVIGCGSSITKNGWPTNSPLSAGYSVNILSSAALHQYDLGQNHFVSNGTRGYLFYYPGSSKMFTVHDDYFETAGQACCASYTSPVNFIHSISDGGRFFTTAISNTNDFSQVFTFPNPLITTNLFYGEFVNYPTNSPSITNIPVGGFALWNSNAVSATNAFFLNVNSNGTLKTYQLMVK